MACSMVVVGPSVVAGLGGGGGMGFLSGGGAAGGGADLKGAAFTGERLLTGGWLCAASGLTGITIICFPLL